MDSNRIEEDSCSLEQASTLKENGNSCYRDENYKEALNLYTKAIIICPASKTNELAIFYQNRAATHEMLGNWNESIADCTKSLKYDSIYAKAYLRRAKAYEATNQMYEALDDATAADILANLQNKKFKKTTRACQEQVAERIAQVVAKQDIYNRVPQLQSPFFIKRFFQLFIMDPIYKEVPETDNPKGYLRAKIAFDKQRYEDVISACSQEIELSDTEAKYKTEALLLRGAFHVISGSFKQGKADWNAVINNKKAEASLRANAFVKIIVLHMHLKDKELEPADFESAEKEFPNNPDLYNIRGDVYLTLHKTPEALADYTKAVELAPNHIIAYVKKCCAQYKLDLDHKRLLDSMDKFKDAKKTYMDCFESFATLAEVLMANHRFEEANKYYEDAILLFPRTALLYALRGRLVLQWKKDFTASIELMEKAIEIDDTCKLAYVELAQLESASGNVARAIRLFDRAISLAIIPVEIIALYKLRIMLAAEIRTCKELGIDRKPLFCGNLN